MAQNDFLKSLATSEKLEGSVYLDGESCGNCRYELTYNPYDTNSMNIELFGPPEKLWHNFEIEKLELVTTFHWGEYRIKINAKFFSGELFSEKELKYSGPVTEFSQYKVHDSDRAVERLAFGYFFPLITVTDYPLVTTSHHDVGFIKGDYHKEKDVFIPRRNPLIIASPIGEISLSDEFDFRQTVDDRYPQTHLIRRSIMSIHYTLQSSEDLFQAKEKIRGVSYDVFQGLSLIERTRINWHTEQYSGFDSEGNVLFTKTKYVWASPPHKGYRKSHNGIKKYRSTLLLYLKAYWAAGDDLQVSLDNIVDSFKVANCCRTIETKFIHWHACLDFFKPYFFDKLPESDQKKIRNNMSFSMQLIYMFKLSETPYKDLMVAEELDMVEAALEGKGRSKDLGFTAIRNQYMHDGFHSFEGKWQEAIELTRTMRALSERVFLKLINLRHEETSLGDSSWQ